MARTKTKSRSVPKPLLTFFRAGWKQILEDDPEASTGIVQIIADDGILTEMSAIEFWERVIKEADENINQNHQNDAVSTDQESSSGGEGSSQGVNSTTQLTGTDLHRLTTGDCDWFYYQHFPSRCKLIDLLRQNINFQSEVEHITQMKLIKALHIQPSSTTSFVQEIIETEILNDILIEEENVEIEIIDEAPGDSKEFTTEILIDENDKEVIQNGFADEHYDLSDISFPNDESSIENLPSHTFSSEESNSYEIDEHFSNEDIIVANDTNICAQTGITTQYATSNYYGSSGHWVYPSYVPQQYIPIQSHFVSPRYYYPPQVQYVPQPPPCSYVAPQNLYIPQPTPYFPSQNMYLPPPNSCLPYNITAQNVYIHPCVSYFPPSNQYIIPGPYYSNAPNPYPYLPQGVSYPPISLPRPALCTPPRNYYAYPQQNLNQSSEDVTADLTELPPTPPPNSLPKKNDLFSLEEIAHDALEFNFSVIESDADDNRTVIPKQVYNNTRKFFRKRKVSNKKNDNVNKAPHANTDKRNSIRVLVSPLRKDENFKGLNNNKRRYFRRRKNRVKNTNPTEGVPRVQIHNVKQSTVPKSSTVKFNNPERVEVDKPMPNTKRGYFRFRRPNRKRFTELPDVNKKYTIIKKTDIKCIHQEEMKVCLDEEEKTLLANITDKTRKYIAFKIKPNSVMLRVEKHILDTWGTLQPRCSLSNNPSLEYIPQIPRRSDNTSTSKSKPGSPSNAPRVYTTRDQATQTSDIDEIVIKKTDRNIQTSTAPKLSYAAVLRKKS